MIYFKRIFLIFGLVFTIAQVYASATSFTIDQIRVSGLQRIELGTVFSYLPVKVGDTMTESAADAIITKLYATGFFKDVRLEQQGTTLIINLIERPVISELSVSGDHEFDHDLLLKSLKSNGLTDGQIFDQSVLDQAVLGLKSEYYNRGMYAVVINPTVIPLERNRVSVSIAINEGRPAKIALIQFVGNKNFSQSELLSQMFLTNSDILLGWWRKDDQYSSEKLGGDIEKIRSFYLNRGYINFKLNSVQVQLSPDKSKVYITLNISEGDQYKIKSAVLAGDLKNIPKASLQNLITLKPGQVVNQADINKIVTNLKNIVANSGYAFAAINPVPDIDATNKTVAFTFFIDTGKRIYIRQINISGNDKTRDVVIRREIRQQEDALYNESEIQRSKDRLNLLGYFKDVNVSTEPVAGTTDQVDMNVDVKETNTGSINFGVGYAQGQGLLLNGSISQANLFGSGKSASLSASTSSLNRSIGLSFTDPYFQINGTSLGYDIYDNDYTPNSIGISPYSTQAIGARVRMGVPVSEFDKISISAGFENNQINLDGNNVPLRFVQFTQQYGSSVNAIPVSVGWVRNTTDSTLWPTRGALFDERVDGTLPFVGAQYYRLTSNNTWYMPITDDFVWKTKATLGLINAYDNSTVPFYQNYYAGGISSIPGYYINSLGPKDTDGSYIGGTREVILDNEILFPMPGIKDDKSVRLSVFYDIGSLWGGNNFNLSPEQGVRASYGLGLTWLSPLGPIKLTYALPMFNQPNDYLQPFQFLIGTSF